MNERASGVLMHITSLPGAFGIGDLGPGADRFIDFLAEAGQRYWQFLPVSPGSLVFGGSPYMSLAAMAGNPLLISPEGLRDDGLLTDADLDEGRRMTAGELAEYVVDYTRVQRCKRELMRRAFARWRRQTGADEPRDFADEHPWAREYALFMSIREQQGNLPWNRWPKPLVQRDAAALHECRRALRRQIGYYLFEQEVFQRQWRRMKEYAGRRGIRLIGDLPIYVSYDSVDVWANQACFDLSEASREPRYVAGVPPDYFSETGQRWGNPLYRWRTGGRANRELYHWWRRRFAALAALVDMLRIDHFRGFASYWRIAASERTAVNGRWEKGPGLGFFRAMGSVLDGLQIIAEDLGIITPDVIALRDALGFPGMKILQFAFDSDAANLYLPHNFETSNCVVYTGTHDNNTTLGWYLSPEVDAGSKERARRYANSDGSEIHWDFIRLAMASTARLCVIPMQDVLGFGEDCRMNLPGTAQGNWRWRCAERFIDAGVARRLADETRFYGRAESGDGR